MVRFTLQVWRHPRFEWVMLPIDIGGSNLSMVLNTGLPFSSISEAARDELIRRELLPPVVLPTYVLNDVSLVGNKLADQPIRVRRSLTQADVSGMLGLDFLRQFAEIHFDVASFRLTFTLS